MTAEELWKTAHTHALSLPEAWEDHPWGDLVIKVRKKIFVFLGPPTEGGFAATVKLPLSGAEALDLPGAKPTGYGLGRHGWVSFRMEPGTLGPDTLLRWIDESYRAVAPKTLGRQVEFG
jgi:predicted DNA-binding protein (MmcQ/YjbR family)